MSNPQTLETLKYLGLVPKETILLEQKDVMLLGADQSAQLLQFPRQVSAPLKQMGV
jgi:hypothetical protein